MGQVEIYELMRNKKECGDTKYYTGAEIKKLLRYEYNININMASVFLNCNKLVMYGFFEISLKGRMRKKTGRFGVRCFRCK